MGHSDLLQNFRRTLIGASLICNASANSLRKPDAIGFSESRIHRLKAGVRCSMTTAPLLTSGTRWIVVASQLAMV